MTDFFNRPYDSYKSTLYYRNDYKHTLGQIGALAEFYILIQSNKGGAYLKLGLTTAHVKTEVNTEIQDSVFTA